MGHLLLKRDNETQQIKETPIMPILKTNWLIRVMFMPIMIIGFGCEDFKEQETDK